MKSKLYDEAMAELYLSDLAQALDVINSILTDNDQAKLLVVLRQMAQTFGWVQAVAGQTHLNPTPLYRALAPKGNSAIGSLLVLLNAMEMRLAAQPLSSAFSPARTTLSDRRFAFMEAKSVPSVQSIRKRRLTLATAVAKNRSNKWTLRSWSQFIKTRDLFRCVCCDSRQRIQAHHIIRKTLYPWGAFETGNGITLCGECHKRVHAEFNGRPNLTLPLGAEQGDDQDEWSFLFGLLRDAAVRRGLDEDEFYYLGDHMLKFFVRCQGYDELHEQVIRGEMSRIRFAHEIWRPMPEAWYTNFVSEIVRRNV